MNFEDEPYVRVYKRRTTTMAVVGWEARAVLRELFLVVDRSGVLDLDDEDPSDAVTAVLGDLPADVVSDALDRLKAKGCIQINGRFLVLPRFREAQEAKSSDKLRAKESRERRRIDAMSEQNDRDPELESKPSNVTPCDYAVTPRDAGVTPRDETVTAGHTASHRVTQYNTVLSNTVLSSAERKTVQPSQLKTTKSKRQPEIPAVMPDDWQPPDELIAALGEKYQVSQEKLKSCVPEFRYYWVSGGGSGKKRGPRGWITTFATRIRVMAERGELYAGPGSSQRTLTGHRSPPQPNDETDRYQPRIFGEP